MGNNFRLLVSSRNIRQTETVILIDPAIRDAAPRTEYNPWSILVTDLIANPIRRPYADPIRMIGRKRPDGTAIPNVMSPSTQYIRKKMTREDRWYSVGVFVEKILRTASSFVVRSRVARSL